MNKELEEKAIQLNQWILSQEVVKEYQKYEKAIQNNPELLELEKTLKDLQKQIVNKKYKGEDCENIITLYQQKKEAFDYHPLVYNLLILKEEVNNLLIEIQEMINNRLNQ